MRSRPRWVVGRVVDAVDGSCLGRVGRGRQRKVGVATALEKHRDLVVDAAPPAVRPSIVEGPVAVDEAIRDGAITSPAKQPMFVEQGLGKVSQAIAHRLGGIPVVVKVDLDVAEPAATQLSQRVEELWTVSFLREEERVLRRTPVEVSKLLRHSRVPLDPCRNACALDSSVHASIAWLEMIGYAKKNVCQSMVRLRP